MFEGAERATLLVTLVMLAEVFAATRIVHYAIGVHYTAL